MSKLFFPLFIAVLYGIWRVLDFLQLPNTFSIILVGITLITGLLWCFHKFTVLPRRKRKITRLENRTGRKLTEEEKLSIDPISDNMLELAGLFPVLAVVLILRSFVYEPFQIPSGSMEPTLRIGDFLLVEKYAYGIKDPIFQHTLIATGKPKRGDVVVFKAPPAPSLDYIKRVIGLPGDHIKYDQNSGALTVTYACNNEPNACTTKRFEYTEPKLNEEFVVHGRVQHELTEVGDVTHQVLMDPLLLNYKYFKQDGELDGEWTVPADSYFVMGDSRDNSEDSRAWGFVPEKNLVGKAIVIWLSLEKEQNAWPTGIRTERLFKSIK